MELIHCITWNLQVMEFDRNRLDAIHLTMVHYAHTSIFLPSGLGRHPLLSALGIILPTSGLCRGLAFRAVTVAIK